MEKLFPLSCIDSTSPLATYAPPSSAESHLTNLALLHLEGCGVWYVVSVRVCVCMERESVCMERVCVCACVECVWEIRMDA
jgi:hypothetical protein